MMKPSQLAAALVAVSLMAGPIVGCTSTRTQESAGEYIDDATISTRVRAQLIDDRELNLFKIDVTTFRGVVQLSGFVDTQAAKERAGRVARETEGVVAVRNDLVVK